MHKGKNIIDDGSEIIIKCSVCSGLIVKPVYTSWNMFGTSWTDGKINTSMSNYAEWLKKCPYCNTALWCDEEEQIGDEVAYTDNICIGLKGYLPCSFDDYLLKLEQDTLDREKEIYLRIRIWWLENDKRRIPFGERPIMTELERNNILLLYNKLDITEDAERIIMAEIKRELGEFEEVKVILKKPFSRDVSKDKLSTIIKHTKRKNPFVVKIFPQVSETTF